MKTKSLAKISLTYLFSSSALNAVVTPEYLNVDFGLWTLAAETYTSSISVGGTAAGTATLTFSDITGFGNTPINPASTDTGVRAFISGADENAADNEVRWTFEVIPAAGWTVDGISVYSFGPESIADPTLAEIQSNGVMTLAEDGPADFFANGANGDSLVNGDALISNPGTSNLQGWAPTAHRNRWSINSAGASTFSTLYQTSADVRVIANESLYFDAGLTRAIPEPTSLLMVTLSSFFFLQRRKRV